MKSLVIFFCLIGFSSLALADFEEMCSKIDSWEKKAPVPADAEYNRVKLAKPVDAKFASENYTKDGWVMIDVRKTGDTEVGKIPKTIHIESHHKEGKNQLTKEEFLKKSGKFFKRQKREVASIDDANKQNIILFCNGRTCHRSTAAACHLRRMGVNYDNLHIMLGGFPEWKESGLPVR